MNNNGGLNLAGDLMIGELVNGILTGGYFPVGNTTSFTVSPSATTETKKRISKQKADYGNALDTISRSEQEETKISFELNDLHKENLNKWLLGSSTDLAASTGSNVFTVAAMQRGQFYELPHLGVSNVVIAGVNAEDITIDGDMLRVAVGAAGVVDGEDVTVNYDYDVGDGFTVEGGVFAKKDVAIKLIGKNRVNNKNIIFAAAKAELMPSGDIDLFSDDFVSLKFDGLLYKPVGWNGHFKYTQR